MRLRNVRCVLRNRPDIHVVLNYKVTDSVVACCPGWGVVEVVRLMLQQSEVHESATRPFFWTNLHFSHHSASTVLTNWLIRSKKRRVASSVECSVTFRSPNNRAHSNLWEFTPSKRIFWKPEPTIGCISARGKSFSIDRGLSPLKSASKRHDRCVVQSSNIFVWGA